MGYLPQFESDIYISYAAADNVPSPGESDGWVDTFSKSLEAYLGKSIGRLGEVKVNRNTNQNQFFTDDIQRAIESSAAFVVLISSAYLSSNYCGHEFGILNESANSSRYGRMVDGRSRVCSVHLQGLPFAEWPKEISNITDPNYQFFSTESEGSERRYTPNDKKFEERMATLARNLFEVLSALKNVSVETPAASVHAASSSIFISYRRGDSNPYVGRLYDRLSAHFGKNRVFMDLDTIEPGDDFVEVITNYVSSCSILLAIINKSWLHVTDDEGRRRLHNPDDFVNLEVSIALKRNIRVIPVLVQGASMPRSQDLPESLTTLSRRNALELSDSRWSYDVGKLIEVLEKYL